MWVARWGFWVTQSTTTIQHKSRRDVQKLLRTGHDMNNKMTQIMRRANSVWSSWLSSDMTSGTLSHILYGYPAVFTKNYVAVGNVKIENGAQQKRHTYC